jgi:uncharacterized membrane protein
MLPVIELRGGLIYASAAHIPFVPAFIICFVGNVLPIPFILLFIERIFNLLRKVNLFRKFIEWLEKRAVAKSDSVRNKQLAGLFAFVAIPLPGTGGWTGAIIASMLEMPKKKAFLTISCGIFTAGIIMSILAYALPDVFGKLFGI